VRSYVVGVEIDQNISGADDIAGLDARSETAALELHGIEPDVHEHLDTVVRRQRDGVPRRVELDDATVAGRDERCRHRIDRHAVANHPLREDWIRYIVQRHDDARQRRAQHQMCRLAHVSSLRMG
jgi:hypothetical protein